MQMDLRTINITPLRNTFSYIERMTGSTKPPSRYQEATLAVQPANNFQYRPTWAPQYELFDPSRSKIVMEDWYAFKDPRQYYYGSYTLTRAKMQDAMESSLSLINEHQLVNLITEEEKQTILNMLMPLRHVAWGSNLNNASICAYGYGTAFTQPHIFHSIDQLGIAQYLTAIGLSLADTTALQTGRQQWLEDTNWQPLRKLLENSFVIEDPFELFMVQNAMLDGLLYPAIYQEFISQLSLSAHSTLMPMTQFMVNWFKESSKWVDATLKTAAAESEANNQLLCQWYQKWQPQITEALLPILQIGFSTELAEKILDDGTNQLIARLNKVGLNP